MQIKAAELKIGDIIVPTRDKTFFFGIMEIKDNAGERRIFYQHPDSGIMACWKKRRNTLVTILNAKN